LVRCATKRCIAFGRDVGEFLADGVVVDDGNDVRHCSLVVRRGQLVDCKIGLTGHEMYDVEQQGDGADQREPWQRRGGGDEREMRGAGGCKTKTVELTFATKTVDDTARASARTGLGSGCSGDARGSSDIEIGYETFVITLLQLLV
jgi:hypothetical protein